LIRYNIIIIISIVDIPDLYIKEQYVIRFYLFILFHIMYFTLNYWCFNSCNYLQS
jgi:hypothetical protein